MTSAATTLATRRPVTRPGAGGGPGCLVMGVVNVTPDSFSDGGRHDRAASAVEHGCSLLEQGAAWVDVGGESTRPGAGRVPAAEELRRVLPVVRALSGHGVPVSIDTTRAAVARAAVEHGATMVNDVSGGRADPRMAPTVADLGVPYVLTHSRGPSRDMAARAHYGDVVLEVRDELLRRVDEVCALGVDPARVLLDPGLGFAKTAEHTWRLLGRLDVLVATGFPVLVGASRKGFLAAAVRGGEGRPAADRDGATAATTLLAAQAGAWGVRVHDVDGSMDVLRVLRATVAHRGG
ncbi:dihydropteroate synthase [Klenkia taihuensis]|uniref:Dihydropteroate synthase n=1 Tax=Klenkia taihuensis TaxID=1225127 RepID=A0A1I1QW30_9ACTN|nr:dihydropteroate synthase [Klenkia taihuensis]GHE07431.1 dihydropteroate synthase [Klenkia taihuensis]SFD26197.1 Dihydropteroate synthase [Klenkia taihuensis]